MPTNISDVPVPKTAYLNFDGLSIKEAITERLTEAGLFTDQNYEGSNLSHFNEIVAYVFSMLLFYLNKNSNEGQFTEAQLYENMSRIVKQLDYKPIGFQTATLSFLCKAQLLNKGLYTIPRYSYIEVGGVKYSFKEDITFAKTLDQTQETLTDMSREKLLYQGDFIEHPSIAASGNDNEIIYLTVDDAIDIDHFSIDIYVKDISTLKWTKWDQTQSLYLAKSNETKYELRLNENKRYEVKFGNDINGKKLNKLDLISIYYLKSNGPSGEVGANVLAGKKLIKYDTIRLRGIIADTIGDKYNELPNSQTTLSFTNDCVSSSAETEEGVESIRTNAPAAFRSQYRIVTQQDYITFIKTNFSNLVQDAMVLNNSEYLANYMKYFSDLGLMDSNMESRALFNQVNFADSCNFNNVYVFVVPKTIGNVLSYVNPSQKELIISSIREERILTSETILMDPVYLAFDIGLSSGGSTTIVDRDVTKISIEKKESSRRNDDSIKNDVSSVITSYFNRKNLKLGQTIDLNQLTANILSIDGVKKIHTYRTDDGSKVGGLRLISWNAAYPTNVTQVVTNISLEDFQFPYLVEDVDFTDKITISTSGSKFEGVEY